MTREENREIIKRLRPLFELAMRKSREEGVSIDITVDVKQNVGWLCVGDYEFVQVENTIKLEYAPVGHVEKWETELEEEKAQ